ncbi:MAG: glycoside hydrolase family 140 protein [Anaerolineae bacterium]|nr:glycoside hydrolase family 140 protein [Anaerolineae bacterium]
MSLPRIHVHAGGRYLITETGDPFFWLGDTAWELFHRLTLDEAGHYLDARRQQGYTVIQAVILAELDGLHTPNANEHVPLCGDDPARPNPFYFRHVDAIIRLAAGKGLYIGLLPTWGDKVCEELWGAGPVVFNRENARRYGHFLGQRYRDDANLLWILGGDRPAAGYETLWAAMAEGISEGMGRRPFFTYHPMGGASSSASLHEAGWLDMNMLQSGHVMFDAPNWEMIAADYGRRPAKPVLDGEPNYEHHPVDPYLRQWTPALGRYTGYDVRKQAYRAVFAGACGHTYGSHSVWQMWTPAREPVNFPMPSWDEAIYAPGAAQLVHLKALMLSRPYFSRIPAQELLPDVAPTPPVGDLETDRYTQRRASHPRATRCANGTYAMVYFPLAEQTLRVDLQALQGQVRAWWYDPRNGKAHPAGEYPNEVVAFTSPIAGPDWVLVLDSMVQAFGPPGF